MNWTDVSMMNCLFSLSFGVLLLGVVISDVDELDGVEWTAGLSAPISLPPPGLLLEPDGVTLTTAAGLLAAVRRLLAEKALCSRAAVVDRFRIRPFIFYKNRK